MTTGVMPGVARAAPVVTSLPLATSSVPEPSRNGVVVVGIGAAVSDAAWPVAKAVYGDASLRPGVADREARALAGDAVPNDAPPAVRELGELRGKLGGADDVTTRVLLAEIARRTRARGVAVVTVAADGATEVRVYDAAEDRVESTRHRSEPNGGWTPFVGALHTRYPKPAGETTVATAPTPPDSKSSGSFLSSPWFWVAIGAATVGGVAAYALTRDDGTVPPVRVDWSRR